MDARERVEGSATAVGQVTVGGTAIEAGRQCQWSVSCNERRYPKGRTSRSKGS